MRLIFISPASEGRITATILFKGKGLENVFVLAQHSNTLDAYTEKEANIETWSTFGILGFLDSGWIPGKVVFWGLTPNLQSSKPRKFRNWEVLFYTTRSFQGADLPVHLYSWFTQPWKGTHGDTVQSAGAALHVLAYADLDRGHVYSPGLHCPRELQLQDPHDQCGSKWSETPHSRELGYGMHGGG